ncbi:MAG: hypothetical protein C5B50_19110 [Verrucomicrobia bacterium]|nr:MAG: hypothetical protein C5B50_19110 [Verrucomicrobiota bacterium]
MKPKSLITVVAVTFVAGCASAQSALFDFDNAPVHTSLPLSLTVGGITARFSATGQGYSIQPANTLGFTPAGFSGYCFYPNSIYAADLLISFSQTMKDFSILYAPEEYACDSSATMRVTAYLNGVSTGTATTNAQPGTWPSETLAITPAQGFNSVVVHYDAAPVTGGDWGPVFMADNMVVTAAPPAIVLTGVTMLTNGVFSFGFTNLPGQSFSVLTTTNLSLKPLIWNLLGTATEVSPGQYLFTDYSATNRGQRFYRVRSP